MIVGAVGLALYVFSVIRSTHASSSAGYQERSVGLHAERQGNELKLAWNAQSPALKTAPEANLGIEDGAHKTHLNLTRSQIRQGSVKYAPYTDDVIFHLKAFDGAHNSSEETLEVLQSRSPAVAAPEANDIREPVPVSTPPETGAADRAKDKMRAESAPESIPGTMIVRGVIVRDTPVDVRIPADSRGRPAQGVSPDPVPQTHKRGGIFHQLAKIGKAPAHLWPFHHRGDKDSSR